ncbi:enolase-phosphatase E1-like [Macrobrachium rosenbergii]|uniref:enolase-phosphatase E1-like n=1 Tax=Macrobrachium rosenbergii TaxID=79674 RepID=UPI0034D415BA
MTANWRCVSNRGFCLVLCVKEFVAVIKLILRGIHIKRIKIECKIPKRGKSQYFRSFAMTSHFQVRCLVLGIFLLTTCSSHDLNPLELGLFKAMVDKCLDDKTYFIAGFCQEVFQRADELGLLPEGKVASESPPLPVDSEGEKNSTGAPSLTNHTEKTYIMNEKDTSEVQRTKKHVRIDVGVAEISHFDERTHQAPLTGGHQVNNMDMGKAPLKESDPEKKKTERLLDDSRFTRGTIPVEFTTTNKGKRSIKQLTEDAVSYEESLNSRDFKKTHLKLAYDLVELLREALQRKSEIEFSRAKESIGYALSAALDIEPPHTVQQETERLMGFMVKLLDNKVEMEGDSDGDDEKVATDVAEYLSRRTSEISQYSSDGDDASLFDTTTTTAKTSPHDNHEENLDVEEEDILPTETSAGSKEESVEEGTWEGHEEIKEWRPRRDVERWIPRSRYDIDDSRLSGERYKATYLSSEAVEEKGGNEEQEIEECFARYIIAEENFKSEEKSENLKSEESSENLKSEEKSKNLQSEEESKNLKDGDKSDNLKSEILKSEAKSENLKSEEKNENSKSEDKSDERRLMQRAVLSYVDEDTETWVHHTETAAQEDEMTKKNRYPKANQN